MGKGFRPEDKIVVVCNLTPTTHFDYRVGVPEAGYWEEILNSDAKEYGGSGQGNLGGKQSENIGYHGQAHSVPVNLPPLGILFLKKKNS